MARAGQSKRRQCVCGLLAGAAQAEGLEDAAACWGGV
jgi:hypothetical protein